MAREIESKIETGDLAPRDTLGGYHATWQEGTLIAHAWLEAVNEQPERGYALEYTYNHTQQNRQLSDKQIDAGTTLVSKLRNHLEPLLQSAGWKEIARPAPGRSVWQHESRIAPPKEDGREIARQVEQDQAKQRTLHIPARSGEDRRNIKGYKRTITATPVTFTCERCQSEATRTVYPGKRPQYCDACAVEVKKEKTRARVARLRAGQKTT